MDRRVRIGTLLTFLVGLLAVFVGLARYLALAPDAPEPPQEIASRLRWPPNGLLDPPPVPPPPPPPPEPWTEVGLPDFHRVLDAARDEHDGVHDACGALVSVGTAESVPHLIRVLRVFPDEERKGMVCTWAHCVEALQRITGARPGISYSAWRRWWDEHHPGVPLVAPTGTAPSAQVAHPANEEPLRP